MLAFCKDHHLNYNSNRIISHSRAQVKYDKYRTYFKYWTKKVTTTDKTDCITKQYHNALLILHKFQQSFYTKRFLCVLKDSLHTQCFTYQIQTVKLFSRATNKNNNKQTKCRLISFVDPYDRSAAIAAELYMLV